MCVWGGLVEISVRLLLFFWGLLEIQQRHSVSKLWGDKLQSSQMALLARRESCMDWWSMSVKGLLPYAGACVLQMWFPWVSKATYYQDSDRHLTSAWVGNSQWSLQNAFVNTSTIYRKACSGENQSLPDQKHLSPQSLTWGSLGYSSGFVGSSWFATQATWWPIENTKGYLWEGSLLETLRVENASDCIDSEMPFYLQFQCVPEGDPHVGVLWSLSRCRVLTDSLWVSKYYLGRLIRLQSSQAALFLLAQRAVKIWWVKKKEVRYQMWFLLLFLNLQVYGCRYWAWFEICLSAVYNAALPSIQLGEEASSPPNLLW